MEYQMKKLGNKFPSNAELTNIRDVLFSYIKGQGTMLSMTEKARQFFTWGANNFKYIVDESGLCYGLQFNVSGLLHKGRVRIYYNRGSDYFDVELLRARKDEMVWGCDDLDFEQLHNVLHRHIERTDDPEV